MDSATTLELAIALFASSFGGFAAAFGAQGAWDWLARRKQQKAIIKSIQSEWEENRKAISAALGRGENTLEMRLYETSAWDSIVGSGLLSALKGDQHLGRIFNTYRRIETARELENSYATLMVVTASGKERDELVERFRDAIRDIRKEIVATLDGENLNR